jgi:phage I-like protein
MNRKNKSQSTGIGIAPLAVALNASGEIQLTPAGEFRAVDGRPAGIQSWVMDAQAANDVIAFCNKRQTPFVLDYEHQTLLKEQNGQPAPAAGWFTGADLTYREGEGLFAKVQLTERAREFIDSGEYKFVSPVILYNKKSGRVTGLHSAALTNTPAIDGMDEVIARAAASMTFDDTTNKESLSMDIEDLMEQLRWLLNLPTLATKDEIVAELQKAVTAIKQANTTEAAAANFSLTGLLKAKDTKIASLAQLQADLKSAQDEVAGLKQEKADKEVSGVVEAALTAGKLLPAQKDAALALGKSNLESLKQMIEGAQPIAALSQTQTRGNPPEGAVDLNNPAELAALAQKHMDSEKAAGRTVSSAEAVAHVKAQGK